MEKPCLYLLCGLPFAGKTTLAKALEDWLGIRRVALDEINTERGIWNDETGLSPEEWEAAYQEVYRRIATVLSQGESVIDDSTNFTRDQRDRLRSLAEQYHARTQVIFVDVPVSEVRRRWQENRLTALRADVRDEDFAQVLDQFVPPAEGEHVLRYDGTIPVREWVHLTSHVQRACKTRRRSKANPARPYPRRLMSFSLFTCPSTTPLLVDRHSPARTAALSRAIPLAKRCRGRNGLAFAAASQAPRRVPSR